MAALFQLDSPVLHFGPRMPAGVRYSQRKFLLWPALMYRVVAPEVIDECLTDAVEVGGRLRRLKELVGRLRRV